MAATVHPAGTPVNGADTALIPGRRGADTAMPVDDVIYGAHQSQSARCSPRQPERNPVMTTTVKSRNRRAGTDDPGQRRNIEVRALVLLGAIAAAVAITIVLLLNDPSPASTSPQISPHPHVGVADVNAPVGSVEPLECVPSRYVHAC
jgi:hypothetical protein